MKAHKIGVKIILPTQPTTEAPGGQLDLEHVNSLQRAVAERASREDERERWQPQMTPLQWAVSLAVAAVVVFGIFTMVDNGLRAFQMFMDVYTRQDAAPPEPPQVDVTQPIPVIVVPAGMQGDSGVPAEPVP